MVKMSDIYVVNIIKKIRYYLEEERYFLVGQGFYNLTKYGIVIGDDILVFLTSELSDVFRNSLRRVKEFEKYMDKTIISNILSKVKEVLNTIVHKKESLDSDTKIEIFDALIYIISKAERIQAETIDLEDSKIVKRRIVRSGIS